MTSKLEVKDGRLFLWLNKEEFMALEDFFPAVERFALERYSEYAHYILDYPWNRFIAIYDGKDLKERERKDDK